MGPYRPLTARAGCSCKGSKLGAETNSKAGGASDLMAGCSPTLPKQEEQSRSSSSNWGQPRVHSDKAKPEIQQVRITARISDIRDWAKAYLQQSSDGDQSHVPGS